MYRRFIRTIERPTAYQVFAASGGEFRDLPIGHEVQLWHHGEDGEALELHDLRGVFFIDYEPRFSEYQDWAFSEVLRSLDLDEEQPVET